MHNTICQAHHHGDMPGAERPLQSVGLAPGALAASGCRESQLEQLQVAFEAERPGFVGKR